MNRQIEYSSEGTIASLFCKVCGTPIASTQLRVIQVVPETKRIMRFSRHDNYTEIKIAFTDGSFHVTHGCSSCMKKGLSPELLNDIYLADCELMGVDYKKGAKPIEVTVVDHSGMGIV